MTKSLFRVGKPRITETTSKFDCGRGTGGMGTGIYAYRDLDAAKKDSSYIKEKQPIYEFKNICENPIVLTSAFDTYKLNDAGIEMRCKNDDEAYNKIKFNNSIQIKVNELHSCGGPYSNKCQNKLKEIISSAIKEERDCSRDKKGKETYGSRNCSHAMNYVLRDLGFDCVLPTDEAGGNSNTFGSIILKETVDKKLGRKTVGSENIENFGKKL